MIQLPERFDDIRPYYDSEIPAAMERIASDPGLPMLLQKVGQGESLEGLQQLLRSIHTFEELKDRLMHPACNSLVSNTMTDFTFSGSEYASSDKGQLYVSNHRDIVMDAFLLQLILVGKGLPTSHITFGSNLMEPQLVADLGLSCKMFKTVRKTSEYQSFMDSSIHLSDYINYVAAHGESLWIAQRNGRTKDGIDKTEPGLLRMLLLGKDKSKALRQLNITPVSISYQWEPCDILKAVELYKSRGGAPYIKAKGEDLNSIITGIISPKGNVHLSICKPIDADEFPVVNRSVMNEIVSLMDSEIYSCYKVWNTNYVAYDILHGGTFFAGEYSPELKEQFITRMTKQMEGIQGVDDDLLRSIYLQIYAGPVETCVINRQ